MTSTDAHARRRNVRFWHAFVWLLVGAVTYAVALAVAVLLYPDPKDVLAPVIGPSLYLTPLFGMPYLFASARQRGWVRRVVYFSVVLTCAHVAANYLAWRHAMLSYSFEPGTQTWVRDLGTGAVGGFAGGVLALMLLVSLRLAPFTAASRAIILFGIAALTALGALGMAEGLQLTNALEYELRSSRFVFWFECVHLPWQACLAFFLAWLMRLGRRA
ncbi:hypothetical protein HNP52_002586 [Sphingomonas kyeonggiensis]|uniref:Uncharacterized protein n=1 Tax=Sphingomonas kyeonggiensis TaxID=1268553 RepID=A0A7W7K2I1_9SPHN|nr:hypothetical protein [Sphingomonas kyeonggiensis]MBB4839517.1 hypothetical protein [Sphingomonas kyeonggiensis]